ncbi:MAG: AlpA family phage regulatory protein [Proteobacteria bacterium]|nr:AlpA family phage regulatory protein [Pseudomonadota bacterium]
MSIATLWRLPIVKAETGFSRSTLYQRIKKGLFVPPVSLGGRSVAFPANEVSAINAARIAGKSDDEIRDLVEKLVAARALAA